MKAAIYARVSDDKLTEEGMRRQDIQRQIELLLPQAQAFLQQHLDWEQDIAIYKDDGVSAFKEDWNSRPDFVRLIKDAEGHHLQRIWVETLDRWSRRVVDGLVTLKKAADAGLTVVSIAEGEINITQSTGWFRTNIALMMAEWASRDKSDKVKSGMARRALQKEKTCESCGIIHLGRHPLTCACQRCQEKGRSKVIYQNKKNNAPGMG